MSNRLDYDLDVLASDPIEINNIAQRLREPSTELVGWMREQFGEPHVQEVLKERDGAGRGETD
jgi:hypothetical protein